MLLARRDKSFSDVMRVLIEYRENIGDAEARELAASTEREEGQEDFATGDDDDGEEQRGILAALITYLQSIDV